MRIGLDISPLVPHRAGIGNYVAHLLTALVRDAPEHEYFLYTPHSLTLEDAAAFKYPHVRLVQCHKGLMGWHASRDRVDLFHGLSFKLSGWGRYGGLVTIYDLAMDRLPQRSRKLFGQRWSFLRTRRTARRATRVVTISNHSASDIVELYGVPRERIAIVTPAVGPEFHSVKNGDIIQSTLSRYAIRRSRFILAGGGAEPRKNVRGLIQAFAHARELRESCHLVIVGGMGRGVEEIQEAVRVGQLESAVIFPGHVPFEDLRALYSACAVFVFPSLYEGFGMPVLEAMACGAPVVSSNTSSLPEVAGDAALLVDPMDLDAMADAMTRVVQDRDLSADLRRRGAIRAKEFSWERSARDLLKVYRDLVPGAAA